MRKVCENSRAGSCDEKIKGMTIIVSWKVDVLITIVLPLLERSAELIMMTKNQRGNLI